MPKGGGAVRGIGEKFTANPVTGIGSFTIPFPTSPSRAGTAPALALTWESVAGNTDFGAGWQLQIGAVTRKTDKGIPRYVDGADSDVFVLAAVDDLVPMLDATGGPMDENTEVPGFSIRRYRPRIEGGFERVERWTEDGTNDVHWRVLSRDNVQAVYGRDATSRIADPTDPTRVFSWLLCQSRDDVGNAVIYEYKAEDATGVDVTRAHERARGGAESPSRTANRHLKRIRYGNQVPLLDLNGRRPVDLEAVAVDDAGFMFEVVFDYGEHDPDLPTPDDTGAWTCRHDPVSTYRAGFEIRNYRLCRRVLLFHQFPDEPGVGADCLVRSLDLEYRTDATMALLETATERGYQREGAGYSSLALPPVTFGYSVPTVNNEIHLLDPGSLDNLPLGVDGAAYEWADLDSEGLSGVLSEQKGELFYKPNLGGGRLGPSRILSRPQSGTGNVPGVRRLLDLAGNGRLNVARLDPPAGFFSRDDGWNDFQPFESVPTVDWASDNLELVDLTGDGLADLLTTEDGNFAWHPSLATAGFGVGERVTPALDEDLGPRLVLADSTQTIFLADMSGDGLTDLVRIRNGDIRYWPNLGYGRFGAAVVMDDAPVFDLPDQFAPRRVRLADIDGSGTIDVLYLAASEVVYSYNQSGNGWGPLQQLVGFPLCDDVSTVRAVDVLGNGTACLVWSSPLSTEVGRQLRYIDLMGGSKPHLLISTTNNVGGETLLSYATSTAFYLADQAAGTPWITRLPFPVHVVEKVERVDHVSRTRFVSRFTYHHGYFDSTEREFRGFARVDQLDTDEFDDYSGSGADGGQDGSAELYQHPVTTRTWFHTGAFAPGHPVLHPLRAEYFQGAERLPEPNLPPGLSDSEFLEALRALKGLPLRSEVFSFDGSGAETVPYSIVENSYSIRRLQPREAQPHAVVLPISSESITSHCERNPADARVEHNLALEVGPYGNPISSAAVVYGRQTADAELPPEVTADQQRQHILSAHIAYTTDIDVQTPVPAYRLRTPYDATSEELTGVVAASGQFTVSELRSALANADPISFEVEPDGVSAQRRMVGRGQSRFLDNALVPLPAGQWDTLGLGHQRFRLAFTAGLVAAQYAAEVDAADLSGAGYVHVDGDAGWWSPSGTDVYPADPAAHFFRPVGTLDPTGLQTVASYDRYDLLTEQVQVGPDAWNRVTSVNDYRVLGPTHSTDPNGNRRGVVYDTLGMVVASAVMGKEGAGEGDTLTDPTVRMEYDLSNWMTNGQPTYVHTFAREQYGATNPRWQESYAYSNGGGDVAMTKSQAHPGTALQANDDGTVSEINADPRWVASGRTVVNNKGNPVKKYEPFFSATSDYDADEAIRGVGVTPLFFYDPLGRLVRTEYADGTTSSVSFDPWESAVSDANDAVLDSAWYAERGSPNPDLEPEPSNPDRRAAWLTAHHANTPALRHFDSLGRMSYAVADYGAGVTAAVRTQRDLTGGKASIYDQHDRLVAHEVTNLLGSMIQSSSAEKGTRWAFSDVLGRMVRTWDQFGRSARSEYDQLNRPTSTYVTETGQGESLLNYVVYGDRQQDAAAANLLGVAHQLFDTAGKLEVSGFDFAGNPTSITRVLTADYSALPDWSTLAAQPDYAAVQNAAAPFLDAEAFTASAQVDAIGRPTRMILPYGTTVLPAYNEANFLASLYVQLAGQAAPTVYLQDQDYDAKGQRQHAHHGNDVMVRYHYDQQSFRLTDLTTASAGDDPATQSIQRLTYTYDAVGNVVQVADAAQQQKFFANAVVTPEAKYTYDALYQLVKATGRELAGGANDIIRGRDDLGAVLALPHVNDVAAVRNYTETYEYDTLGNLLTLQHAAAIGNGSWTRHYQYAYQVDAVDRTNRLAATSSPGDPATGPYSTTYDYDNYGQMSRLHLPAPGELTWNVLDQLQEVHLGGGGTAYYCYAAGGSRIRKVIERPGGRKLERIYLGALEIYRERQNASPPDLERRTVHVSDNAGRIAQIDVKTRDDGTRDPDNPLDVPLVRYQYPNHLGSAVIETDGSGSVISYEEYHPFGTTSYRSGKPSANLSLKRYRFAGKERDDETGLYYVGARYYAPWLGRWTSPDPAGFVDGLNLFAYCRNDPVSSRDPSGTQHETATKPPKDVSRIRAGLGKSKAERDLAAKLNRGEGTPEEARAYFQTHGHPSLSTLPTWTPGIGWLFNESKATGGEAESVGTSGGQGADSKSSGSSSATPNQGPATAPPSKGKTDLAPAGTGGRVTLQEVARPSSITGTRASGTLHLWSGPQGKAEAKAAIASKGSGWMMGDIEGQPTPEHAAGEAEFAKARAAAPGGQLTQAEFERIWGPRSADVVGRGAFAGHPVEAHGTPRPGSIQPKYEWPARSIGGGLGGGLMIAGGLFGAITGGQDRNPAVAIPLVIAGVGEATSGIMYAAGAFGGVTEAMAIGTAGATAFGGVGAAIGFGVAAHRAFERGDTTGGIVNTLGAIGGILMVVSLFTPVGWVGLLAIGLVAFATGFNLGRWLSSR